MPSAASYELGLTSPTIFQEMNAEVAQALKTAIETHLDPHLECCYRHEIFIDGDQLELLAQEKEDSVSQAVIIRLTVADKFKEIYISNILMLDSMKRQGIGKGLIAKIYGIAKAFKYLLFVVQMTDSFFHRMVKRGAAVIEGDCVQITDRTNPDPK